MELCYVRDLQERIDELEKKLSLLRVASEVPTSKIDGLPRSQSLCSRVEEVTTKILDVERELDDLREELVIAAQELIIEIVEKIHGREAQILVRRYCLLQPFKQIAAEMYLSEARIYAIHQQAVLKFNQG